MFFVFNKNKIVSYGVAVGVVSVLFLLSTFLVPNNDVMVVQTSTNLIKNEINNNVIINNIIE